MIKELCQKWKTKTNFSKRLIQFDGFTSLTLTSRIIREISTPLKFGADDGCVDDRLARAVGMFLTAPSLRLAAPATAQGCAQNCSLGLRPKSRKWVGVLGKWATTPSHQLGGMEERYELPQRGSRRSSYSPKVFHYFQHRGGTLLTL